MNPKERVTPIPPTAKLPWNKSMYPTETDLGETTHPPRCVLLLRPLYGSRDAPMRWLPKLPQVLAESGLRQLQSDVYYHTWHNQGEFGGTFLANLGDLLLFKAPDQFRALVLRTPKPLRAGELETLSTKKPIAFAGLSIGIIPDGAIILSREPYIRELPTVDIDPCITGTAISNQADSRCTFPQPIGAPIWPHPTSQDISSTTTQLSTSSVEACKSPDAALDIRRKYNKIVKFTRNRPRRMHYTIIRPTSRGKMAIQQIAECRIISFPDAGSAPLTNSYSFEGDFLILGRSISRGGSAHFHGGTIDRRCAKNSPGLPVLIGR